MSETSFLLAFAAVSAAFIGSAVFFGRRLRSSAVQRYAAIFSSRKELPAAELVSAFASSGTIAADDLMAILEGAAEHLGVRAGQLRPSDSFDREMRAQSISPTLTARAMGTLAYKKLRKKYPSLKDSSAEMRTMGDFVAAIGRDIERTRKTP